MAGVRFVAVHGHFYQPPRENPWLETVEIQDSAAPCHDWNERVTMECYAPNTAARRLAADGRILDIVNNFERISFDVGPTLMDWLAEHRPDVHDAIVAGDRASVAARGRGNAIAQVYNHMIMPLATARDQRTQVRWGVADFRARFGRDPEGMWLPETAVDEATLEALAEAGLAFTILAPHQAARVRPSGTEAWENAGEQIDPRRAYAWTGPRGHRLTLFFYDALLSRAVAFEGLLQSGEWFADRLLGAFARARGEAQLVHCATDGESYGHHSTFGEMALAAAAQRLENEPGVELTNYAAFLAAHPPAWDVEVRPGTSWSCPHGLGRWRTDCGCRIAAASQQRWRAPLREALDWLRDEIDAHYEQRAGKLLKDPWEARDDYIAVILDRSPASVEAYFARHAGGVLDARAQVEARQLLEMQRNRMLMFTSCGWFFDDLAGLEPVQNLRYAAMALQYLRELDGPDLEPELVRRLAAAPGRAPDHPDGAAVWHRLVRPSAVDWRRVTAHYAITNLFDAHPDDTRVHAYRVQRLDAVHEARGETSLALGRVHVTSTVTGETRPAAYAVAHFGGHDLACGVRLVGDGFYDALKADLLDRYQRGLQELVRGLDACFHRDTFGVTDLFIEDRRRVLRRLLSSVVARHEATLHDIWEDTRRLLEYLREADTPVPDGLAVVARFVLERQALAALAETPARGAIPERVLSLVGEARGLQLTLDLTSAKPDVRRAVERALARVAAAPDVESVNAAVGLIKTAESLRIGLGHWEAQNRFYALWTSRPDARETLRPLAATLGFSV